MRRAKTTILLSGSLVQITLAAFAFPAAMRAQCQAVRGRFHEQVFGWMVHAMVFAGDDPATIWGSDHADHGDHRH